MLSHCRRDPSSFDTMSVGYISTTHLEELRQHTAKDEVLQALSAVILRGWPDRQSQLQPNLRVFLHYRDELTNEDWVIMKGHKAVIPESLHKEYNSIIHKGHPGVDATKCRARGVVF